MVTLGAYLVGFASGALLMSLMAAASKASLHEENEALRDEVWLVRTELDETRNLLLEAKGRLVRN